MAQLPATTKSQTIDRRQSLERLGEVARDEHEKCVRSMQITLGHAIRAGEALLEARERTTPKREWTQWLRENFPRDRSKAYLYMRLASHKDKLPPGLNITGAERLLQGLPDIDGGPARNRVSDERKADAQKLRAEGWSYKEIAAHLEVSVSTVYAWFSHGTKKTRDRRARLALKEQEKRSRIAAAVRKQGGALAEAYSLAERLDGVLGRAREEAKDPDAKNSLSGAHSFQSAMRDLIVSALGVEP